jgi:hypothetical protein
MTSTSPPPPKQGGSGPFIVAALVMLLLMGGLIYWKVSGSESTQPTTVAPPPTAAPPPILDEPPPPPPPPDEPKEDAGTSTKKTPKNIVSSGGCSGECKGEAPGNLRSMLAGKGSQSRGCYERALRQNSMLAGRLKLGLRIGPNGNVCSANVTMNELGDPGVASCVLQMFKATAFPAPQGGCVDVEVPLRFEPKK